jgi:vacuolar-type H+-ATPase subunit E/Vma4
VPYQHFTNSIENYFSMLKSRLQKIDGLTHTKLKENISKVLKDIPKDKYTNIFKGAYNRDLNYVKKISRMTRKLKNYKV